MLLYFLKCRESTISEVLRVEKTKIERIMLSSKCAICGCKKSRFIKEQGASDLLTSLL